MQIPKQIIIKNLGLFYLLLASTILSLVMLHSNELWTMESRWATVCKLMLRNHDYLHPYLFNGLYLDKPLLSYWLMIIIAKLLGHLNEWALRLPSALAGITCIYCVYRMGKIFFNEKTGLIAGWLLTTTYFFIAWARIASADMLNVAGILLSLIWYLEHREDTDFLDYLIFFLIIALTSLCKGLGGLIIPILGVVIDITLRHKWQEHFNWKIIGAAVLALSFYLAPFIASMITINTPSLKSSGIYEVFSENIQRYFAPFDHQNPWYTYFIYVPFYLLPWTFIMFFAVKRYIKQWHSLQYFQRWLFIFTIAIFLFFSISGSRRGYYILPLIPFTMLIISDWIYKSLENKQQYKKLFKSCVITFYLLFFCFFALIQPLVNYVDFGAQKLAAQVNQAITDLNLSNRSILLLNSDDDSLVFYLNIPQTVPIKTVAIPDLSYLIRNPLKTNNLPIIIAAKQDLPKLQNEILKNYSYKIISSPQSTKDKSDIVLLPLL